MKNCPLYAQISHIQTSSDEPVEGGDAHAPA